MTLGCSDCFRHLSADDLEDGFLLGDPGHLVTSARDTSAANFPASLLRSE